MGYVSNSELHSTQATGKPAFHSKPWHYIVFGIGNLGTALTLAYTDFGTTLATLAYTKQFLWSKTWVRNGVGQDFIDRQNTWDRDREKLSLRGHDSSSSRAPPKRGPLSLSAGGSGWRGWPVAPQQEAAARTWKSWSRWRAARGDEGLLLGAAPSCSSMMLLRGLYKAWWTRWSLGLWAQWGVHWTLVHSRLAVARTCTCFYMRTGRKERER